MTADDLDPDDFMLDPRVLDLTGYPSHILVEMVEKFAAIAAKHGLTPDEYRKYRAMVAEAERIKSYVERCLLRRENP
jgi:hypothetical protein